MKDERKGAVSASGFPGLARCPGKHQQEAGLKDTTSAVAAAGNVMHDACAGKDVALTPDEADLVRRMKEQETTMRMMVFDNEPVDEECREERLWAKNKKFSGKCDVILIKGSTALVIDYKTGRIPVEPAETNWQLKGYAVLTKQNWKVDTVFVSIVQPYCGNPTIHKYNKAELTKAQRQVSALVRKANSDAPKLNPGESQCKYCKAKALCPALRRESMALATLIGTSISSFTGDQVAELLDRCGPVEGFMKELRGHAKKMLESDANSVPGYKLSAGTKRRKITDNKAAYGILADSGTSFDDILSAVTFSVSKIEKLARGEMRDSSAHEARELVAEAFGDVIETTETSSKLERDSNA